jgi:two-component system response regulator FixJ
MQQGTSQNYTVLLVDNDARSRAAVADSLHRAGFQTRAFDKAEELLDTLDDVARPACVIAELHLPGMNGIDLSQQLREQLPVIILTAAGDVATAVRALRGNVLDYLTKPYVERDLITRLQAALSRHGTRTVN